MWRKRMQPKSTFLADPVRPFLLSYVRHRRVVVWRVRAVLLFFFFLSRRRNSARVDHAYSESYAPVPIRCITLARC